MDKKLILVDTSLFIDHFRKKKKENTLLVKLSAKYNISISVITKFEILVGAMDEEQKAFWNQLFDDLIIFPIADKEASRSADIIKLLKKSNKLVGLQDIFIAATAIENNLSIATLNYKDFTRIPDLNILSIE